MKTLALTALLAFAFGPLACLRPGRRSGEDISKVNRSIHVEAGKAAGDVSTVNGSIQIDDDARADDVETSTARCASAATPSWEQSIRSTAASRSAQARAPRRSTP